MSSGSERKTGKRWWKTPRNLVIGQTVYCYSLLDRSDHRELRVWRQTEKTPMLCLRLTYPETWAIDLFRPKTVAYIIGWHEGQGRKAPACFRLQEEPALFQGLLDIFFPPEEQKQREQFLERLTN